MALITHLRTRRVARRYLDAEQRLRDAAEAPVIRTFLVIDEQGFHKGTVSFVQRTNHA